MITITIKGLSKAAHQALKQRAATHGRSLNTEAIAVLEASVHSAPTEAEGVIQRARQFRSSLKVRLTEADLHPADFKPADFKQFKRAGRK